MAPQYELKDKYYKKAKKSGYRARSSFKLLEIQRKYRLIEKDSKVLDIRCAPGSWLQVVKQFSQAHIVGVDIVGIKPLERVTFIQGDIQDPDVQEQIEGPFDVVLADIAPKTSGNKERDQYISFELSYTSYQVALKTLNKGGHFIVKTFQSKDTEELVREMREDFKTVKTYFPKSTRERSKEMFIIGMNKK